MTHFGRPPGNSIMTMEQMLAMEQERTETRLYDRNEDASGYNSRSGRPHRLSDTAPAYKT